MGRTDTNLRTMTMVGLLWASAAAASDKAAMNAPGTADWPHWAGPNGDCTSNEKGLLKEWPKGGPPVLWRIPVGIGSNHPSVAGDDLCFAQLDADELHETIKCVDANTGKEKWGHTCEVPPIWHVGWGELGVRATPTITDRYIYEVGTFGNGFCFERKTGKIVWKHDFRKESPYLDGSLKNNGNLEWKGFNGPLVPVGDKFVVFYWQGGNPAIPAWDKTPVSDKMQIFAYSFSYGRDALAVRGDLLRPALAVRSDFRRRAARHLQQGRRHRVSRESPVEDPATFRWQAGLELAVLRAQ